MDLTHFGLSQRPFPGTPDTRCYYPATGHERALARLQQGLTEGEGFLLLSGEPGTGKTLLCHCLLDRLEPSFQAVFLINSHFPNRAGLLQAILYDLGLPYEGRGEQELRLALTEYLVNGFSEGRATVLLIDEAQHLNADHFEELRLLGNLESRNGKALQVILVGQPKILETLRQPELAALRQRLVARIDLVPLGVQEAADYLLHHIRLAGGKPGEVLADEVLELLARTTGGVPRLLNQTAHQAMLLSAENGAAFVDVEAALEALSLLGLEDSGTESEAAAVSELGSVQDESALSISPTGVKETDDPSYRLFRVPGKTA